VAAKIDFVATSAKTLASIHRDRHSSESGLFYLRITEMKTNVSALLTGKKQTYKIIIMLDEDYPIEIESLETPNGFAWEVRTNLGELVTYNDTRNVPNNTKKERATLLTFILEDLNVHLTEYDKRVLTTMRDIFNW